jgi:membrane-associated phospholipid phosphatase
MRLPSARLHHPACRALLLAALTAFAGGAGARAQSAPGAPAWPADAGAAFAASSGGPAEAVGEHRAEHPRAASPALVAAAPDDPPADVAVGDGPAAWPALSAVGEAEGHVAGPSTGSRAPVLGPAPFRSAVPARLAPDTLRPDRTRGAKFAEDVRIVGSDAAAFFTAPARWSGEDWYWVGGAAASLGASFAADRAVRREVVGRTGGTNDDPFYRLLSKPGNPPYLQVLPVALYAGGLAADHDPTRVTGRLLTESVLFSGNLTIALRFIFGRSRPANTEDPFEFNGFQTDNDIQSFPSGHSTIVFASTAVFAERIGHPAATAALYSVAVASGFSRIMLNRHWVSDVVSGALIGTSAGLLVCRRERQRRGEAEESALRIVPAPGGLGLALRF